MKFKLALLLTLTLLPLARAEDARFFRLAGPLASTMTAFTADGYVTWTNAPTNAPFIIQTTASLVSPINWVDYLQVSAPNPVTIHRLFDPNPPAGMAYIPAGLFQMGDGLDGNTSEQPVHTNTISAFYMDRYEVPQALWNEVYQWAITNGYSFEHGAQGKAASHPAHSMTWYDAAKWCNARSERAGRTPAYYTDVGLSVRYRTGEATPYVDWSRGYRLPTEAEWEQAARGGLSGMRFPWGNTISWSQANYYAYPLSAGGFAYDVNPTEGYHATFNDGVLPYTSPAGYFAPNGYGLYDMAGNVWEWCWDGYGAYASGAQTDPHGAASDLVRVIRGGSWNDNAFGSRTADRLGTSPTYRAFNVGFRSVLPPSQP